MTPPVFEIDPSMANAVGPGNQKPLMDRLALEQIARAKLRSSARDEMQSDHCSAAEKIRAWERLHGLQLPRDPNHVILVDVARLTGLRMEAVLEEQRLRAEQRNSMKSVT